MSVVAENGTADAVPVAPSRPRGKLDGIEGARGIAAAMVVFYHASNHLERNVGYKPLGGIAQFGHAGVDFFFVLSGFIIWFVHAGDLGRPERLGHYAQRRFTRIYPVYWFVTLLTLALGIALSSRPQPIGDALYGATLLPTFEDPFIGVAWTLQHEMMFYLLFAIGIVNLRAGILAFAVWFSAIFAFQVLAITSSPLGSLGRFTSSFNVEFFFGMFAGWLTRAGLVRHTRALLILGIALFAATACAEDVGALDGFTPESRLAYGLPAILLVLGASGVARTKGVVSRALMGLGRASYSIYLSHLLFIGIVYKAAEISGVFTKLPPILAWLLMSGSGIVGGLLISRFVEYPLMAAVREKLFARPAHAR